jgi:hypothetical protein
MVDFEGCDPTGSPLFLRPANSRGSISSRFLGGGACGVLITSIAVKNVDVTLLVCLSEWNDNLRAKPTHTLVTLTANWI